MKTLNLKIWRDLKQLKVQSFTTATLIIAGVALLVASWSAYQTLQISRDKFYNEFALADMFASVKRAPNHVLKQLQNISGVQKIESRIIYEGLLDIKNQKEPAVGRFISLPDSGEAILNKIFIRRGRLPRIRNEIEVVVNEGFAKVHKMQLGDSFGATIQGQKKTMLVVGIGLSPEYIYALSAASPLPDDLHFGIIWVNQSNMEQLSGMSSSFNDVALSVDKFKSAESIKSAVDQILKPYGSYGSYGRDRLTSAAFVDDEIKQQKITAFFSPAVFLSIAAFLIHVIAARLVTLQRTQIATLKALGYSNSEISAHYIKLILTMMSIGILPGILLGGWLGIKYAQMYEDFFHFPELNFSLNIKSTLVGIFVGLVPGIIGAYGSIREAYLMAPAEAMRPPSPPSFHRSLFERVGFISSLSVYSKITWRNLLFRPWRLILVVLGMSAAVAIVVFSGFWSGTLDSLLNIQFEKIQREDVSINLLKPQSVNVLQEIKKLAGVVQVEGYRVVPVRVFFKNFKKEIQITGYPQSAQLRQLVGSDLKTIPVSGNGLFLGRYYKKKWGIKEGDFLDLEPIEGTMSWKQIRVLGFTDDLIGQSASLQIDQLWKIMGEEPSYNNILLKIDPQSAQSLYIELKKFSNIASVNFKTVMFKGIQESFGSMMNLTTNILIGFALVIAISIIYNSVRVSFSERAWEIASLRVLGFKKIGVLGLLLAEVFVQVLLSIIPGCLMGYYLSYLSLKMLQTEYFYFPLIIEAKSYSIAIFIQFLALSGSLVIIWFMLKKLNMVEALKARD